MTATATAPQHARPAADRVEPPAARRGGWPAAATVRLPAWAGLLLSLVSVGGLYVLLHLRNDRYYYIDDAITGEMPNRRAIGELLLAGDPPWLNTQFLNGAAHAIEYSHGVFNPVNLAFAVLLARMDDMGLAGLAFVGAHGLVLTAAAFWLARTVGANSWWAAAFAVSVGFQPVAVSWYAAAWYEGLTHFAWFVLALTAALRFSGTGRHRYGWLLLVATFLTLTAGWPLAVPYLAVVVAVLLVVRVVHRADLRRTGWLAAWAAGGAVCALPALYPLVAGSALASRTSRTGNDENFLVLPLEGLLQLANPGFYGWFQSFDGYRLHELPMFYAAWFVLPVLVLWRRSDLPRAASVALWTAVGAGAVAVLGALGPERLGSFRFPVRFLQYAFFFALLAVLVLAVHGALAPTRRRLALLLGGAALLGLNAWQAYPEGLRRAALGALLLGGLGALAWSAAGGGPATARRWARAAFHPLLVVATAGTLLSLALTHEEGRGIDWGFDEDLAGQEALSLEDYTLYYGGPITPEAFDEYRFSMIGVTVGDRQVNGYTSLGNRAFRERFPMSDQGDFAVGEDLAQAFTEVDPATGKSWLELVRVDQVIATLGPMDEELAEALGPEWDRGEELEHTVRWTRPSYDLPGLVSHVDEGVRVSEGSCGTGASRECVAVSADDDGRVVLARLWYPGYRAELDGQEVPVERHGELLVAVDVPAGTDGELVVGYRPPGLVPLSGLAGAVLLALAVLSGRAARQGRVRSTSARNSS